MGGWGRSTCVERGVASIDWGLVEDANRRFVMSEQDLEGNVRGFLTLYALDAARDAQVDFCYPDKVILSLELFSRPVSLQARLEEQDGVPAVILERMNDTRLFIVGGIVSGGINRGFRNAWDDSPLQITNLAVKYGELTINLESKR